MWVYFRFFFHISVEYLFTFWTCFILYKEYGKVASMRLNFLASQGRRAEQFTVSLTSLCMLCTRKLFHIHCDKWKSCIPTPISSFQLFQDYPPLFFCSPNILWHCPIYVPCFRFLLGTYRVFLAALYQIIWRASLEKITVIIICVTR